jgi:MscS family membrane protein
MSRPFIEQHLPAPLLEVGPQGLLWWQWLAIPAAALLAIAAGWLLGWATRRVLGHLAARTRTNWDDVLIERVAPPLTLLWAVAVGTGLVAWLSLPDAATAVAKHLLRALTYLAFFWGGLRSIHLAFAILGQRPWARQNVGLASLLPLGRKIAKGAVVAIGLVAVLNELGFQVASLLAGVGLGGLVIALAAQKTVENLFASVSIGVDQPFRVGDLVRVEEFVANVEAIGMRSTRFRTPDRTIITIPNGKLAEMRTETFAPRDRIRLLASLGLSYDTTAGQMRAVLRDVEAALRAHPKIWLDGLSVRFAALGDSTLNVEVIAWFQTADWGEFTAIRQELLLRFMEIVERAGTSLAFPTRTVRLERGDHEERARRAGPSRNGGADRDRTDDL